MGELDASNVLQAADKNISPADLTNFVAGSSVRGNPNFVRMFLLPEDLTWELYRSMWDELAPPGSRFRQRPRLKGRSWRRSTWIDDVGAPLPVRPVELGSWQRLIAFTDHEHTRVFGPAEMPWREALVTGLPGGWSATVLTAHHGIGDAEALKAMFRALYDSVPPSGDDGSRAQQKPDHGGGLRQVVEPRSSTISTLPLTRRPLQLASYSRSRRSFHCLAPSEHWVASAAERRCSTNTLFIAVARAILSRVYSSLGDLPSHLQACIPVNYRSMVQAEGLGNDHAVAIFQMPSSIEVPGDLSPLQDLLRAEYRRTAQQRGRDPRARIVQSLPIRLQSQVLLHEFSKTDLFASKVDFPFAVRIAGVVPSVQMACPALIGGALGFSHITYRGLSSLTMTIDPAAAPIYDADEILDEVVSSVVGSDASLISATCARTGAGLPT